MNAIKKADYIYVERVYGAHKKLEQTRVEEMGVCWVALRQMICGKERNPESSDKRLKKRIKKLGHANTIIMGNEKAEQDIGLSNYLFDMRKQELFRSVRDIFRYFQKRMGCSSMPLRRRKAMIMLQDKRSSFLLVLDSKAWTHKEILDILWAAKDCFEDIYIEVEKTAADIGQLVDFFCEECGVVLHITPKEKARVLEVDGVLLLLEHWEECYKGYAFRMGYVVAEWETGMVRKRKRFQSLEEAQTPRMEKELYSGFVYERKKRQLFYEMAVTLCSHSSQCLREQENPISIVAIYGVE